MSVAHDLSSEIAAAILVRTEEKEGAQKLKELKEVVLLAHSVLQNLTLECGALNRSRRLANRELVQKAGTGICRNAGGQFTR